MKKQFKKGDACYVIHGNFVVQGTVTDYHTMKTAQKKWLKNRKNKKKLSGIGYGWPDQDMVQVTYLNYELPNVIWREVDSVKKDPQDFLVFVNQ